MSSTVIGPSLGPCARISSNTSFCMCGYFVKQYTANTIRVDVVSCPGEKSIVSF